MRILITGGTGLIGRHVIPVLLGRGDDVVCVSRDAHRARKLLPAAVEVIEADPAQPGPWTMAVATADAVINLAGENVASGWLWTGGKKRRLRRSRLRVTAQLAAALHDSDRPCVFLSGSASGYYGDGAEEALGEDHEPGHDFLSVLACEWERAALVADSDRCRVVCLRLGIVLSPDGGALARLVPIFARGQGGPLGTGRQYFPWIHVRDLVRAILFALDTPPVRGGVNVSVPDPPRQREFAQALGRAVGRAARLSTPAFVLRLVLGQKAEILLASQRMVPSVLRSHGFHFEYTDLDRAFADLLGAASPTPGR
jgi:uncharacterized protein